MKRILEEILELDTYLNSIDDHGLVDYQRKVVGFNMILKPPENSHNRPKNDYGFNSIF